MAVMFVVLCFVCVLAEVCSQQTYPYIYLMGQTLANHSYVDITTVGDNDTHSVQCITDLSTCCTSSQGIHRGDWYFPSGGPLSSFGSIFDSNGDQRVYLHCRNNVNSPTGIYRCDIATNDIHDDVSTEPDLRATVYVGLYTSSGGDVTISGGVMYDSDQMTLTCISTGGPATTVTWTRDSTTITGGQTVLNDPVTARYTHTLTVTGRQPGLYSCTVSNNKPSMTSENITLYVASPPTKISYKVESNTSIILNWTPPTPLEPTTGYIISFTGGGKNDSIDIDGGSSSNYTLTGLDYGVTYNASIIATSEHFNSEALHWGAIAIRVLQVNVTEMGNDFISLSWSVSGDLVDSSEIVWSSVSGPPASGSSGTISSLSNYTLDGLQRVSVYYITVTVYTKSFGIFSGSIFSFTVPECERESMITAIAVGSSLGAVVLAIVIVGTVVSVVICLLKRKDSGTNRLPNNESIKKIPNRLEEDALQTTTNEAYNAVKENRYDDGDGEEDIGGEQYYDTVRDVI